MPDVEEVPVVPPWVPPPSRWRRWTSRRVVVEDESMAPTLRPGDRLLVDRSAYRSRAPGVGEVVVFPDPADPTRWLIKRVVAVGPGRFSAIPAGPGTPPGVDPDPPPSPASVGSVTLPEGSLYVCGDARGRSRDSRAFGPIPFGVLVGRAYRCYAPADRQRDL